MTREEFELGYAERSGIAVEKLHAHELRPMPCRCDDESCNGWQMAYRGSISALLDLGQIEPEDIPEEWRENDDDRSRDL